MMLFSSIDQFYVFSKTYIFKYALISTLGKMGEIYGGFLGAHFKGDDIHQCYGNAFGSRIKVIVITKNFTVVDKKSIKILT